VIPLQPPDVWAAFFCIAHSAQALNSAARPAPAPPGACHARPRAPSPSVYQLVTTEDGLGTLYLLPRQCIAGES
jgi:hypothetical protein